MIILVMQRAVVDTAGAPPADVGYSHVVKHPSNGAILAYCDTANEAQAVCDIIRNMDQQLRAAGHKVV